MDATTEPKVIDLNEEEVQDLIEQREELDYSDEHQRNAIVFATKVLEENAQKRRAIDAILNGETPGITELSPDQVAETITAIKTQFDKTPAQKRAEGYEVQEGLAWSAIQAKLDALERTDDTIIGFYNSLQAGTPLDALCEKDGEFCIAETFSLTLGSRKNCTYNRQAQLRIGRRNCNGNAVDQSIANKMPLMETEIFKTYFIGLSYKNQVCYDWLQVAEDEDQDKVDFAPYAYRFNGKSVVSLCVARNHCSNRGWRGARWV